ncbi:unnamed protein product [Closterium sp. Yama58-4]|nr:unnamed protein product [Closterium sp. Yama58-4]
MSHFPHSSLLHCPCPPHFAHSFPWLPAQLSAKLSRSSSIETTGSDELRLAALLVLKLRHRVSTDDEDAVADKLVSVTRAPPRVASQRLVAQQPTDESHPQWRHGRTRVSGSIKYVRLEHWPAASGDHSVALNGHGPATLAQRVVTRPGEFYFVHFELTGDPGLEDEGAVRSLRVSVMDEESGAPVTARTYEFDTFSHGGAEEAKRSREGMGWRSHTLAFEAPGAAVTLLFASTTPGIHGPVIDNVRVHKQNATSAFLHSPNTLYHSPTIDTVGPAATPEACGRRCLEIPDCRGFSIDIPVPGLSDGSVQCHLKMHMKKPSVVGQNRADSYVLKRAECSFGHSNAVQCPDMLPISGMLPMACVAHKSAKRQTEHPFAGTCKALKRTNLCPYAGGYFAKGFGNIGSADDYRRCSCVEGSGGIARLQCGHVV